MTRFSPPLMPDVSRARLQKLIEEGSVEVNGEVVQKVRQKVTEGDEISLLEEPHLDEGASPSRPRRTWSSMWSTRTMRSSSSTSPAGLVVHPGAGNPAHAAQRPAVWRYPELREVPRAGIVHRLDRDTTGLMVSPARLPPRRTSCASLERTVKREYWAFARLRCADFVVETPIGRDPRSRTRFKCVFPRQHGRARKPARTRARCVGWSSIEGLPVSWVACRLDTGRRTHQIRVHHERGPAAHRRPGSTAAARPASRSRSRTSSTSTARRCMPPASASTIRSRASTWSGSCRPRTT